MLWIMFLLGCGCIFYYFVMTFCAYGLESWNKKNIYKYATKFFVSAIATVIVFIGLGSIKQYTYDEIVETNRYELIALSDSNQISGDLKENPFYFREIIEEKDYYSFYYKVDGSDNGIKKGKIPVDDTIIYEKNETPKVFEFTIYNKNKLSKPLQVILMLFPEEKAQKNYVIYVPEGSIQREYNLDLK